MGNGLLELANIIHEHTGEEGPELEALTFYIAAGYADAMDRRDIGDYFEKRCKDASSKCRWAE